VDVWTPAPQPDEVNPTGTSPVTGSWPADPLGGRRQALEAAAALVRQAQAARADQAVAAGSEGADGWAREVELLLAERARLTVDPHAPVDVELPGHLSVSQLVGLRRDPDALARAIRRPLPGRPNPYARRGTAFHAWLEHRFGAVELLDVDELPGAADEDVAPDETLARLRERFEKSEWADRVPVRVEVGFATTIAGVVIRGRMDAVYQDDDGGYDVVDWKTGRRPSPGREADAVAVQLAAYRVAWAELAGVPVDRVRAAFHYVAEGVTVRPADLLDLAGLTELLGRLPSADRQP
jgi:DNA helicase-2/ATP-dependent DNA helicase PcrA